jgi:Flp pilus assembly pilin Flp
MLASPSSNCECTDNKVPLTSPPLQSNKSFRHRRGATAMEYLFVLSLIFVAAMTGINYFGQSTKKLTEGNSEAIQKATQGSGGTNP